MYTRYVLEVVIFLFVICFCAVNGGNFDCGAVDGHKGNCAKETGSAALEDGGNETISTISAENLDHGATKNWEIELTNGTGLLVRKLQDAITLQIARLSTSMEARKKRVQLMDVIPYLIIPGFISAGVLPWLIPGMKMAVMGVAMINQMAFTSSLFSLIRGYIFDTSQEDHIVYLNHGYEKYKNQKHPQSYRHR